ncbi:hypothetical protein SUDANB1_05582 [Streptomyces sp. enrichment culture]|uniref:hypothetical protein n=1 Tax=Streptomyces sp. enrichment culture TaxID=1795815 RepID=UPI003F57C4A5
MRALVGGSVLALSLAVAVALVWWSLRGTGRHRAPRRRPSQTHPGTGLITPYEPDPIAVAYAAGEVELADTDYCPVHDRITPHAAHADGTSRCWPCDLEKTGTPS